MAVATRPTSRPQPPTRAGTRPRAAAPSPRGKATPPQTATTSLHDTISLVMIGAAVVVLAAVGIAVIWEYGAARSLSVPEGGVIGSEGPARRTDPRDAPTVMYRDMRDGRVMVMEIGPDGTRIKGTIAKSTLPMAGDLSGEPSSSRSSDPTASDRVNALGSAFR